MSFLFVFMFPKLDGYISGNGTFFIYLSAVAATPPLWVLETCQLSAGTLALAVANPSAKAMTEALGHTDWS